ncbi:MAG: NAD(P)/FAD-dependent oxidoreductase [Nitrospirae bacterium]|nr:NAD(P)/FAD-dependent oxidoreductase [Nitrospirota bacterium]
MNKGKRVAIIEERESPKSASVFEKDGYQFPNGPSLFLGFYNGLFPLIFTKAGVTPIQPDNIDADEPILQIVLPRDRVNLYGSREYLLEELNRVFPEKIEAIRLFYSKVDEIAEIAMPLFIPLDKDDKGFEKVLRLSREKTRSVFSVAKYGYEKASRFLYGYGLDIEFKRFIDMQTLLFSQRTTNEINILALVEMLTFLKMDAVRMRDGFFGLSEAMADRFVKNGGNIRYNAKIAEVTQRDNILDGVRLVDGSRLEADSLIASLPHFYFYGDRDKDRYVYIIYLGADADVIPVAMKGDLVMSMNLTKYPLEENFIYVSIVPDNSRQPAGKAGLKISMFLSKEMLSDPERLPAIREEAMRQIRWLMPFSDSRLYYIGDNSEDYNRPAILDSFKSFKSLKFAGCYRSSLRNSYLLSDSTLPSAGIGKGLFGAVRLAEKISKG